MNNAKTANKAIKTALLTSTLLITTTLASSNIQAAEGLSYQKIECIIHDTPFEITVLMPTSFTAEEKEAEGKHVCNSIKPAGMDRALLESIKAVCDTDMNCEYWDRYHKNGIEKIFVAYDTEATRTLAIMCKDIPELKFTDNPNELKTICNKTK